MFEKVPISNQIAQRVKRTIADKAWDILQQRESERFDNPNLKKLHKIAKGGNREVFTNGNLVVKAMPTGLFTTEMDPKSPQIQVQKAKMIQNIIIEQRKLKEVFGEMYIMSRFPNFAIKDSQYYLVTHEPKRSDLYPSKAHENVANLCFLGYFGLTKNNLDHQNIDFIFGALFVQSKENYIKDYENKKIEDLAKFVDSKKAKLALQKYLEAVENYAKMGFRLDLAGDDNVVLNKTIEKYEVVINNSAAKIERIDTFLENCQNITQNKYGRKEIIEFCNQIVGMVNINLLCDLAGRPRVFNFDDKAQNLIKKVLENWQNFYVEKKPKTNL